MFERGGCKKRGACKERGGERKTEEKEAAMDQNCIARRNRKEHGSL